MTKGAGSLTGLGLGLSICAAGLAAASDQEGPGEIEKRRTWGSRVSIGDTVEIPRGTLHSGDVVSIFGDVEIAGTIDGQVVVIGGSLDLSGNARQQIVGVLSNMVVRKGARIGGDLINVAGILDNNADEIRGSYVNLGLGLGIPDLLKPMGSLGLAMAWWNSLTLVLFFVMLLLFAALVPDRVRTLSGEAPVRYFAAFFAGLAGYLGLPIVCLLLFATVIGIPIALLLPFVFIILKWLGMAGILHQIGKRLGLTMSRDMSLLGAMLLTLVPYALLTTLPWLLGAPGIMLGLSLWFTLQLLLEIPAVGLILLTRAGGPRLPAAAPPAARVPAGSAPTS